MSGPENPSAKQRPPHKGCPSFEKVNRIRPYYSMLGQVVNLYSMN